MSNPKPGFSVIVEDRVDYAPGSRRIVYRSGFDGALDWAVYVPGDVEKNMVVYLHGSFANADQIFARKDIHDHWMPRINAGGHPLLSINMRNTSYMSPAATQDLHDLLAHCRLKNYGRRIVLLGGSGGASSAMAYACVHPETIQGVIAMGMCDILARLKFAEQSELTLLQELAQVTYRAYGGSPEETPEPYRERSVLANADKLTMPIILAIGERDVLIPVAETRKIAAAMKQHPHFQYIEIPGGDHDSPLWIDVDLETMDVAKENNTPPHGGPAA